MRSVYFLSISLKNVRKIVMVNHLRTSQRKFTIFFILSYLVSTFILCSQINTSKEAENHENIYHYFASKLGNPASHVKIFDHSSFSQAKKEKTAPHISSLSVDSNVFPFKANRHYALRQCFLPFSHSQQVLAFFNTNLSPPVS